MVTNKLLSVKLKCEITKLQTSLWIIFSSWNNLNQELFILKILYDLLPSRKSWKQQDFKFRDSDKAIASHLDLFLNHYSLNALNPSRWSLVLLNSISLRFHS